MRRVLSRDLDDNLLPKIVFILGITAIYALVFKPVYATAGDVAGALTVLPLIATGWLLGKRAAFVAGVLSIPLNAVLYSQVVDPSLILMVQAWPAHVVNTGIGMAAGWLKELLDRLEQQSHELILEHESLERAVGALSESEERFRAIFETAQDCIFIKDVEGRYVNANPATVTLFGMDVSKIVGTRDEAFFGREAAAHIDEVDSRVLSGEIVKEEHTKPVDGVPITFNVVKVPLRDGTGQITGLCGIARDVTERKRAEILLAASAKAANNLLVGRDLDLSVTEALKHLAGAVNADRAYVFENNHDDGDPSMSQLYEWSGDCIEPQINNPMLQNLPYNPDSARLYETLSAGQPLKGTVKDFPASERAILEPLGVVSILIVPIIAHGELWGFVGFDDCHSERVWTVDEISVLQAVAGSIGGAIIRKQAEEALLESEGRLKVILDSIQAGVVIIDPKTHQIVDANLAALDMVGADDDEVIGSVCHRFICPADVGSCPITDLGLDVDHSERVLLKKDGAIVPIIKSAVPLTLNGSEYLLESFVDIVDLNRAKHELIRAQDELMMRIDELNQRNAEMERFVYTISHDLRTPLVTTQGFVGLLRMDMSEGDPEKVETDLRMIENAVTKMDLLLRDTLELSRIGRVANPPEAVSFGEIVQESLDQVSERVQSSRSSIAVADDWPAVYVDRMRIAEVLVNLIENGIKYGGGQDHPEIEIGWRRDGDEAVFFVRDNGNGIEPDQREKVFGLFYKLNPETEGSGVGLSIVKRIIEVHDGRIWIESENGDGCTFCFTLPIAA